MLFSTVRSGREYFSVFYPLCYQGLRRREASLYTSISLLKQGEKKYAEFQLALKILNQIILIFKRIITEMFVFPITLSAQSHFLLSDVRDNCLEIGVYFSFAHLYFYGSFTYPSKYYNIYFVNLYKWYTEHVYWNLLSLLNIIFLWFNKFIDFFCMHVFKICPFISFEAFKVYLILHLIKKCCNIYSYKDSIVYIYKSFSRINT